MADLSRARRATSWVRAATLVITASAPAVVLMVAGTAKLGDPFRAALFVNSTLAVPLSDAIPLARGLAAAEILVAVMMIALLGRSVLPALVGVGLFAAFAGLLVRLLLTQPSAVSCGCFGNLWGGFGERRLWLQAAVDAFLVLTLALHIRLARRA